jgi:hypothetical protein
LFIGGVAGGGVPSFLSLSKQGIKGIKMNRKEKKVYVPPRITIRQVVLDEWIAVPVSVILVEDSITQETDWGTEDATDSTEGGVWLGF